MAIAVTGDFMACIDYPPNERRVAFRHPTQCEECTFDASLIEQGEHIVGIAFDPHFARRPAIPAYDRFERTNLEPVLDVNRKGVTQNEIFLLMAP